MNQIIALLILYIVVQQDFSVTGDVSQGTPNSCRKQIDKQERRRVCNQVPYVVKYKEWCFNLFSAFRCTKRRTEYRTECHYEYVTVPTTVWRCCTGYAESGSVCIPQCSQGCVHGTCEEPEQCSCVDGYRGEDCSSVCPEGFYGDCTIACNCQNNAKCDPVNGNCICLSGFVGDKCENACEEWKHGAGCQSDCLCNRDNTANCSNINGQCACKSGFKDPICATPCEQGATGSGCTQVCPCQNLGHCLHEETGGCNCTAGWYGEVCADQCPPGLWGPNCAETCPHCRNGGRCNRFTGKCDCKSGYIGDLCEQECEVGQWGQACSNSCDCAFNVTCDPENGTCLCNQYQSGSKCEILACPDGLFGPDCLHTCACQNNATCDVVTGFCNCSGTGYNGTHCNNAVCNPSCVHGVCRRPDECSCEPGYSGEDCDSICSPGFYGDCTMPCSCENGADCEPVNGTCTCTPGYIGTKCEKICPDWTHGQNCSLDCQCIQSNTEFCGNENGECVCKSGFKGPLCSQRCPLGSTGSGCTETCPCQNSGVCLPEDAGCDCPSGWTGKVCAEPCGDSFWGANCAQECPQCYNGASCDRFTGKCECTSGFNGELCEKECPVGLWGDGCEHSCDCEFNVNCDNQNGECICNEFQSGSRCEVLLCPANKFGPDCLHTCACQNDALCGVVNGSCTCTKPGFIGRFCSDACEYGMHGMDCAETCNCTSELPFCDHVEGCISSERYYQLYPPQSSQNSQSEVQTKSSNSLTWVGIAIAALVLLVLVLALIAAFYFRAKARKNMVRGPPEMYPDRNGFVNPNFNRSVQDLGADESYPDDGNVAVAPNGDATYTVPYGQPPQYEDIVGDGAHNQEPPLPPKVAPPSTSLAEAPVVTSQPKGTSRVNVPKDRQSEYHIYEHIEDETSPEQARHIEDIVDPSRIQLTVDNEYAYLDSDHPQSQGSNPNKREQTNPFLQDPQPDSDSHTYSSPSKNQVDDVIKRTYTGTASLYGGTDYSGYANTPVEGNLKLPGTETKSEPSVSTSSASEHELRQDSVDVQAFPTD